jgi:hypothetical protein
MLSTYKFLFNVMILCFILACPGCSYYTSGTYVDGTWMWYGSGQRVTYFNWDVNDPSVTGTNQAFIYLFNGKMRDTLDPFLGNVICEEVSKFAPCL